MVSSSSFIRWCGVVAILGGIAFAMQSLIELLVRYLIPASYGPPVLQYISIVSLFLLLLSVLAAIAGLHALQRESYGLSGALASLTAFVGVATIFVVGLTDILTEQRYPAADYILAVGALVATMGTLALGIVTIIVGVLPRWFGVLVVLGSPPSVLFLLGPSVGVGPALGAAWALIGYVLVREAEQRRVP